VGISSLPVEASERLRVLYVAFTESDADYQSQWTGLNPTEWSGENAEKKYPKVFQHSGFVTSIASNEKISRADVFEAFELVRQESSPEERLKTLGEAFVAAMAWGFRPNSYGPFRTNEMLVNSKSGQKRDDALTILLEVFDELKSGSAKPIDAYKKLSRKINGLGPAFGTKFLYFASCEDDRAPILDAVVANWLWKYGVRDSKDKWLSPVPWKSTNYQRYLEFCDEALSELQVTDRGLIEYLMFIDAQYSDYLELGKRQPGWVTKVNQ
jgi:hypothetical protein